MKTFPQNRNGSILIAVIIVAMLVGTVTGIYLETATSEFKNAMRSLTLQKAMNVAESGAEEALYALNNEDFTGWEELQSDVYYQALTQNGGRGETYNTKVYVDYRNSANPIVYIQGEIAGSQFNIAKQLHIELGSRGLFANGLTAKKKIQFGGNNTTVDSYKSSAGLWNATTNRSDNGSVASVSAEVGDINIQHADIWGYVSTGGGTPVVGNNGSILGADSPSITTTPAVDWNRVANDFYAEFEEISAPAAWSTWGFSSISNFGSNGNTTTYKTSSDWNISNQIDIYGDVTIIVGGNINLGGNDEIIVHENSSLTIYASGSSVQLGGNGIVNDTTVPAKVLIYGTKTGGGQTIKIHGGAQVQAAIYAPDADVELVGGGSQGHLSGAVVARNIYINGNMDFHYDEDLQDVGGNGSFELDYWRELSESTEKLPMDDKSAMNTYISST